MKDEYIVFFWKACRILFVIFIIGAMFLGLLNEFVFKIITPTVKAILTVIAIFFTILIGVNYFIELRMWWKRPKGSKKGGVSKIIRICVIFLLGFLIIFAGYSMYRNLIGENLRKETMISGDKIVKALESYFLKYNKYPDGLNELIPEYIDKIPKAKWGEGWRYKSDGKSFWIETGYKDVLGGEDYHPSLHYFHEGKKWILDS